MFNLNVKINLKLNFKFIETSISFENQFKFYFVSAFYFNVTSKAFLFYLLFWKFNLSMWPISATTNLAHGLFLDFMSAVNRWKFCTLNFVYNTWPIETNNT